MWKRRVVTDRASKRSNSVSVEILEDRRLLSATVTPPTSIPTTAPYGSLASVQSPFTFAAVPGAAFSGMVGWYWGGNLSASIYWGDGTPASSATFSNITGNVYAISGSHSYTTSGTYNVWIQMHNADGTDMCPLQSVAEVAAAGQTPPPDPADDGLLPMALNISATAGAQFSGQIGTAYFPTNNLIIEWGDGTSSPGTEVQTGDETYAVMGTHTYATPGQYSLALPAGYTTGNNINAGSSSTGVATVINPAAPGDSFDASAGQSYSGNVAELAALATAPLSVSIDWGDGSSSDGTYTLLADGAAVISGIHLYATAGNFSVIVSAVVSAGAAPIPIAQSTAVVIPLYTNSENGLIGNAYVGQEFNGEVGQQIIVPFPISSATIDWGDGVQSAATYWSSHDGSWWGYIFFGTHSYATLGSYPLTVTVTPSTASLPDPSPVVVSQGAAAVSPNLDLAGTMGQPFQGNVAVIPALAAIPGAISIDWGDGTAPSVGACTRETDGSAYADISGAHTYAAAGNYTITITSTNGSSSTVLAASYVIVAAPISSSGLTYYTVIESPPVDFTIPTPPVTPAAAQASATTGVAGAAMEAAWTAALPKKAAKMRSLDPTVIIHWGDGTRSAGVVSLATNTQLSALDEHTYKKAGVYRAVAVFMVNGKVVRRVSERLTIKTNTATK